MKTSLASCLGVLVLGTVLPAQCPGQTVDDFEGGANVGGWSFIAGADIIQPTGGNPGAWLRNTFVNSFAPILSTNDAIPSTFVGDYRAKGVTMLSFDAQTVSSTFGSPVGFQMSVLLRDTKGTGDPTDDDYAYSLGPNVPLPGEGWVHYDFPVPSSSTAAVPAGWSGGWAGNPSEFRPGVDWNDVITSVDRVEFWWIDPQLFAIFRSWDIGADNITITEAPIAASSTVRNGSGANPMTLSTVSLPVINTNWVTRLDCSAHGPGMAAILGSFGKANGPTIVFGELLFEVQTSFLLGSLPSAGTTWDFTIFLINDPVFCGLELTLQGICTGAPIPQLTNALDLVLGS